LIPVANSKESIKNNFKNEIVDRLAKKYNMTKSKIIEGDNFTRKVKKTLYSTNRKLMVLQRKKNKLNSEMEDTKLKIEELNKNIVKLSKNISVKKKKISKQVRALYKLTSRNSVMYILKSKSFNDLEKNKKYLKIMTESDYDKVISFTNDLSNLKNAKIELKKSISKFDSLASTLTRENQELRKQVRSKRVLLGHLKKQKEKYLNKLSSIKSTTQKLAISDKIEDLNSLFGTDFFEQKGYLKLPAQGFVMSQFGVVKDAIYKNKIKNNGFFISTIKNSKVMNVHPGKVSFVGDMRGMGKVVVVDHGDHYYTVYGNNKKVFVTEGDSLNIHHKIGEVGYSPIYEKSGSYFEIRYFSEPINPKKWFTQFKKVTSL